MDFPVTGDGEISEASWDARFGPRSWPFRVPRGRLWALGPGVFFEVDGVHHPLNGAGEAMSSRIPGGVRELEVIRRRGPDGMFVSTMGVIACAIALRDASR